MSAPLKAWDIETTVWSHNKRKASPFLKRNWVVTHAWSDAEKITERRFGSQRPGPGWLAPVLQGTRLLAGFNIKFDLLHALQDPDNLAAWMQYVADGGMIWDCQLAEYLLDGAVQSSHMLALDEVAPRYGGNIKFDEVKALWEAGVNTHEIEPALLTRYLVGTPEDHGDIGNTLLICRAQIARARECGQLNSILLNMGALICSTEMERNGMFVDRNRGVAIAADLGKEIAELGAKLSTFLPDDLPFTFNWNSPRQKSALIFGGTVNWDAYEYDCADGGTILRHEYDDLPADARPKLAYAQMDVTCVCPVEMTDALRPHDRGDGWIPEEVARLADVPVIRYATGKNAGCVKTKKLKQDNPAKPKGRTVKAPYTFPRITEPSPAWAGADPGVWSTSSEVIEELGVRNIPFLKVMARLQKLTKDLGTYYIVVDADGNATGMLSLTGDDWIIHHRINHTSTVTTRFSSSDPNLQNIPKGNKSDVKTLFVSRFGKWVTDDYGMLQWVPRGKIIQSDFSSLEVYVQAILTGCRQLIADLRAGLDMHVKRLALKEGITYEECFARCKGELYSEEWDYKRTGAKVFSFQRAYGAGAAKIAASTGMGIADVEALIWAENQEYPEIMQHFERRVKEIAQNRRPSGIAVPHPTVPGIMCNLGISSIRTPDGQLFSYMESPSPEYLVKRGVYASFSPTQIKNYEVQGTGGTWMKAAMYLAVREFYRNKNWGGLALLINTVHDAQYSDADESVALVAAATVHAAMEAASDYIEWTFNWPLPLAVPSDTTWGVSMMDEAKIPGLQELASAIRKDMRSRYMDGHTPSFIN